LVRSSYLSMSSDYLSESILLVLVVFIFLLVYLLLE